MKKIFLLLVFILNIFVSNIYSADFPVKGFVEYGYGIKTQGNAYQKHNVIYNEARAQLENIKIFDNFETQIKSDFFYDAWKGDVHVDVRNLYVSCYYFDWIDIKAGRQTLTCGTGDLVFLNDLYPKDWESFFIGRDIEYLKAPSNALKLSVFPAGLNIEFSWIPYFEPSKYITGERLSYFNNNLNSLAGYKNIINDRKPSHNIKNSELAFKISKNIKGAECALYMFKGFYKRPLGYDAVSTESYFPRLYSYGASIRGVFASGIGNIETSYYDSRQDKNGDDPNIENSYVKGLLGYTKDIMKNFNLGVQYYIEHMVNYNNYERTYPTPAIKKDKDRQLFTVRLTRLLKMQTVELSLFTFYSPSDQDMYLRPVISYDRTDNLNITAGANLFTGKYNYTFFGQMEDNSNIYMKIKYRF
jgi:hypothetical protein